MADIGTCIYISYDSFEAARIMTVLEEEGIPSYVKEDGAGNMVRLYSGHSSTAHRIYVPEEAKEAATEILQAIGILESEEPMFQKEQNRIFMEDEQGNTIAEVTYPETAPGVFTINHTFVDRSLRGQGVASKLVQAAVDDIIERGGDVRATCSYAVKWLNDRGMDY